MQTQQTVATPGNDTGKKYLALGDSYTIGESVQAVERYPVQAVDVLRSSGIHFQSPEIIATTGWTTGDLLSALKNHSFNHSYEVVSLLIGVNNQYQGRNRDEYKKEFTALLERSIQLAANQPLHVIVLSIPDYSVTPFAHSNNQNIQAIAEEINSFNAINKAIALQYKVHYIDITGESRKALQDPTLITSDGLHYSGKEYKIWAMMLSDVIKKMV